MTNDLNELNDHILEQRGLCEQHKHGCHDFGPLIVLISVNLLVRLRSQRQEFIRVV